MKMKYLMTDDLTFKFVFGKKEILEDLINSYYRYINEHKTFVTSNIQIQNMEIATKRNIKNYYMDLVSTLSTGEIINIEIYNHFGERDFKKSCNYMARLYSNQINMNKDNYEDTKKVICLNFIFENYHRNNGALVNSYELKNKVTDIILKDDIMEFVIIRLDLVSVIPYTKHEERFITWLRIITSKSLEEMKRYAKGDEIMENSIEFIKRYYESGMARTVEDYARDKAYVESKKAEQKGKQEGIITTAKNLLALNIDIKDIIKATGLSEKEIKKLI